MRFGSSLPIIVFAGSVLSGAAWGATPPAAPSAASPAAKRGEYLIHIMGCNDCHTPWKMGPQGPEPDMTRMLSGHPEGLQMPPAPSLAAGPWSWSGAGTMTAFAGPWGVSFSANLTPDQDTGLGKWTEEMFTQAIRTGRHEGRGRPILPPMPWAQSKFATDEDMKAIFAYLRTIPAIHNQVPQPVEPAAAAGAPPESKR